MLVRSCLSYILHFPFEDSTGAATGLIQVDLSLYAQERLETQFEGPVGACYFCFGSRSSSSSGPGSGSAVQLRIGNRDLICF